jgi:phytoene desaturase
MNQPHVIIIGGGLAGLAAGCYAQKSGLRATIVEHNLELGGVCTAWQRGAYTVDGCIHWLTGGPFTRIYEELGILPAVQLQTIERFLHYRNVLDPKWDISLTRNLDAFIDKLKDLSPEDNQELERIRSGARLVVAMLPSIDAPELRTLPTKLHDLWEQRGTFGTLLHFRKPLSDYVLEHISSTELRRFLLCTFPETGPAFMLLWMLGFLERGYLSVPVGATGAFRDALVASFRELGGDARLHSTVDEILVSEHRAKGVRLSDGDEILGDAVISTSSAPETVLRLLGGKYDGHTTRQRLEHWRLFDPIILVTFGVELPLLEQRGDNMFDGIVPFDVAGVKNSRLSARVMNGDPVVAPEGHSVVQTILMADYDYWARSGSRYEHEKDAVAEVVLAQLEPFFSGFRAAVRMVDVATPLTFWNKTRAWRGAYEGWMPSATSMLGHMSKTLSGLHRFYMAGQWVEPGGGVPTAVMSGRQAVELLSHELDRPFVS